MPTKLPDERQLREPGSMELDPSSDGMVIDETQRLIASSKVEGTPVFNRTGSSLAACTTSWSTRSRAKSPTW